MKEKIGNVCLNYEYYEGNDLYSDGEIENELLNIVKNVDEDKFSSIIIERKNWSILYHLSDIRQNILNWYPITKKDSVLEVGAGCGALSGILAEKAFSLKAIELSKQRSLINAYRNKDKDNFEIFVGNFEVISRHLKQKFDYITLIGVLEYANSYISGKTADYVFLKKVIDLLKPNGKLIIAIENSLGLKYFAGAKEDHVGMYFEGIEGYTKVSSVKTYSKKQITQLLQSVGLLNIDFYYPYPDYKLPNIIYSDDYLPQKGELYNNLRNFDNERLVLFDESKVFDNIIDAGLFAEFSNSFLIIAGRE